MSTATLERVAPLHTKEQEHAAHDVADVPVKQLLRWQDDGGATVPTTDLT